ncbi:Putative restriction endonuclease [Marvinbryantia formatexigens]|nr:Putative restriction endonuclease [Marvinbryantia formatexigens]
MDIYCEEEIAEYWIANLKLRQIEIYDLDYENGTTPRYYLTDTVTDENKEKLHLHQFPHIKIDFDELFDGVE